MEISKDDVLFGSMSSMAARLREAGHVVNDWDDNLDDDDGLDWSDYSDDDGTDGAEDENDEEDEGEED